MQDLPSTPANKVALIATSDWHFRLTTPKSRAEEDWERTQSEIIWQIAELADKHGHCPIVIAGDVFDDGWREGKCPPELVNKAYETLCSFSKVFVVAGQHDLPNHRLDLIHKSALHTLCLTGKAEMLSWEHPYIGDGIVLTGLSWGEDKQQGIPDPIKVRNTEDKRRFRNVIALHAYCWNDDWNDDSTRHKDCKESDHTAEWQKKLKGYDVAIFGDNHKGFNRPAQNGGPRIYNTGGPINRNSDEKGVRKHVGLIYSDGTVKKHYLDNSGEKWKDAEELLTNPTERLESAEFLQDLSEVGAEFFDFCSSVMRHLKKKGVREDVQRMVTEILKKAKDGEG